MLSYDNRALVISPPLSRGVFEQQVKPQLINLFQSLEIQEDQLQLITSSADGNAYAHLTLSTVAGFSNHEALTNLITETIHSYSNSFAFHDVESDYVTILN